MVRDLTTTFALERDANVYGGEFAESPVGVRARSCDAVGSSGEVRVTGVSCELGRSLVTDWRRNSDCSFPANASRMSCKVGGFICLSAVTDRGVAVTCAAPGRSVAFIGRRPS